MSKKKKIESVGFRFKPTLSSDNQTQIQNLFRWLEKRNINLFFLNEDKILIEKFVSAKTLKSATFCDSIQFLKKINILFSLGGDGTLLGACRIVPKNIPILGINLGTLGFITEFSNDEFYEYMEDIILGKYQIIKKNIFKLDLYNDNKKILTKSFFNDAVIHKNDIARIFNLCVECDNEHIYNIAGDGLIVSSTIGSTAYSLAAGGPIVHHDVNAIVLTPICPNAINYRPIVIPDNKKITIKLLNPIAKARLTLDGQTQENFCYGQKIIISKYTERKVQMISNPDRKYFQTLKDKLNYGRNY